MPTNKDRIAGIKNITPLLDEEIDDLEKRVTQMSDRAFTYKQQALRYKQKGNNTRAKNALRQQLTIENQMKDFQTYLDKLMANRRKLSVINHKLFLRTYPSNRKHLTVNVDPSVNPNNNSLERHYKNKYAARAALTMKNANKKEGGGKRKTRKSRRN